MRLDLTASAVLAYPKIVLPDCPDGLIPGTFDRWSIERIHTRLAEAAGPGTLIQWRVAASKCIVVERADGGVLSAEREQAIHAAACALGCFRSTTLGVCEVVS